MYYNLIVCVMETISSIYYFSDIQYYFKESEMDKILTKVLEKFNTCTEHTRVIFKANPTDNTVLVINNDTRHPLYAHALSIPNGGLVDCLTRIGYALSAIGMEGVVEELNGYTNIPLPTDVTILTQLDAHKSWFVLEEPHKTNHLVAITSFDEDNMVTAYANINYIFKHWAFQYPYTLALENDCEIPYMAIGDGDQFFSQRTLGEYMYDTITKVLISTWNTLNLDAANHPYIDDDTVDDCIMFIGGGRITTPIT